MKKFVSLLILVCVLLACFVSCDETNEEGTNEPAQEDSGTSGEDANESEKEDSGTSDDANESEKENSGTSGEDANDYEAEYNEVLGLIEEGKYEDAYNKAFSFIGQGKHEVAYKILQALKDYEPAEKALKHFRYVLTDISMGSKDYSQDFTLTYNENGLPLKVVEKVTEKGEVIEDYYICEYTYDENGLLIKTNESWVKSGTKVVEYTYDENGLLIRAKDSTTYSDSYSCTEIVEYTYDENRVLTKEVVEIEGEPEDKSTFDYTYTYDANGNLIMMIREASNEIHCYTYDEKGNIIKYSFNYGNGAHTGIYEYTYDTNGNMIREVYSNVYTRDWIYDDEGNRVKGVCTYNYGDSTSIDYNYDAYGNITKIVLGGDEEGTAEASYKLVYISFDISEKVEEIFAKFDMENLF